MVGSQKVGFPPARGHLRAGPHHLPAGPQAPMGLGELTPWCCSPAFGHEGVSRRKEVFFPLGFQDKVSFMRAACWTNQVNWEALNSSHWADPSFLLKADSADGEITSALNSFLPSLNFTPILGWWGSEHMRDTGAVQFSFAGSEVFYFFILFFVIIIMIIS